MLYIYSRAILFIWWHLFKHAHIRYKINNSRWSSRYIMKYAFNLLKKAWMYIKVYDECICVYNWTGYLSQHCKTSRAKSKILVHICKVLRWFLIYIVLYNHAQMHILIIYVVWKSKGAIIIIWQREIEEWGTSDILECLKTSSCDVSMKIADAAAIVHIWPEPSKLQTFNNT